MTTAGSKSGFKSTDPDMLFSVKHFLQKKFQRLEDQGAASADWDIFYSAYNRIIKRFASASGMQDCDIDECSQEVWMAVVRGLSAFEHDPQRARFRSWLYRIVSNKAADIVRSRVKHSSISLNDSGGFFDLADDQPGPPQDLEKAWKNELLRESLVRLKAAVSQRDYKIFTARSLRNTAAAEVAEENGMNVGTVRVTDHRLRKQLQKILCSLTDGQIVADFA